MAEENKQLTIDSDALEGVDANGDGHVSKEDLKMH